MWDKLFDTLFSVKFYILASSLALLVYKHIDQGTWLTVTLSVAGFRSANELAAILKSVPNKASGITPPRSVTKGKLNGSK